MGADAHDTAAPGQTGQLSDRAAIACPEGLKHLQTAKGGQYLYLCAMTTATRAQASIATFLHGFEHLKTVAGGQYSYFCAQETVWMNRSSTT